MDTESVVFVVAGESRARRALAIRLAGLGQPTRGCRSAEEFLEIHSPGMGGCVLLVLGRGDDDLELLSCLGRRDSHLPVIAIAAGGSISLAVAAMKLGAVDFLEESCPDHRLAEAIDEALRWDAANRRRITQLGNVRRRLERLDLKHRQVLQLLVAGATNREIAEELELSVRAIEVRRAKIMRMMRAKSLADLVRMSLMADLGPYVAHGDKEQPLRPATFR